jgi:hypothetical protein
MTRPITVLNALRPRRRAPRCVRVAFWLALGCLGIGHAQPVAAQSSEDRTRDASARALFQEGLSLAEREDWLGAEDRFRRALSLRASPVIAYNLASALIERGKLIEASEVLRKVEHDEKVDPSMKQSANKLQAELAGRIGRIAVTARDKQPSDRVVLDGNELLDAQLGVEIPIDPGMHRLSLERAGQDFDAQTLEVRAGGTEQVTLIAPRAPSPRAVAAATLGDPAPSGAWTADSNPASDSSNSVQPITARWWFWTGVAVVAAGTIALVAVAASSGSSDKTQPAYKGDFAPASLPVQVAP